MGYQTKVVGSSPIKGCFTFASHDLDARSCWGRKAKGAEVSRQGNGGRSVN